MVKNGNKFIQLIHLHCNNVSWWEFNDGSQTHARTHARTQTHPTHLLYMTDNTMENDFQNKNDTQKFFYIGFRTCFPSQTQLQYYPKWFNIVVRRRLRLRFWKSLSIIKVQRIQKYQSKSSNMHITFCHFFFTVTVNSPVEKKTIRIFFLLISKYIYIIQYYCIFQLILFRMLNNVNIIYMSTI